MPLYTINLQKTIRPCFYDTRYTILNSLTYDPNLFSLYFFISKKIICVQKQIIR